MNFIRFLFPDLYPVKLQMMDVKFLSLKIVYGENVTTNNHNRLSIYHPFIFCCYNKDTTPFFNVYEGKIETNVNCNKILLLEQYI